VGPEIAEKLFYAHDCIEKNIFYDAIMIIPGEGSGLVFGPVYSPEITAPVVVCRTFRVIKVDVLPCSAGNVYAGVIIRKKQLLCCFRLFKAQ
jgi:hypothetical protein